MAKPEALRAFHVRYQVVYDAMETAREKWHEGYVIHWMKPLPMGDLFAGMSEGEASMWQDIRYICQREHERLNRLSWRLPPREQP